MRIIPAIDIMDGKCVRLNKGDFSSRKTYNENPVETAREFLEHQLEYLHVVDLDGAKAGKVQHLDLLAEICSVNGLKVDFGGGLKQGNDVEKAFNTGALQLSVGSISVKSPELMLEWMQHFGADRFILAADVLDKEVMTHGWQKASGISIHRHIEKFAQDGLEHIMVTDISKDGMLQGSSLELYRLLRADFPELKFIASGGVSSVDEIKELDNMGMEGAIVGKALYEGRISLSELQNLKS